MLGFSIVIPVFNRVDSLHKTLVSVVSQTFQNFEIIIVDDGSTADVAKKIGLLVKQFSDQRISLLRHEINKNGAAARNTGIEAAKGRFVCFLDSDDTWLPNKLALVDECIRASPNQDRFLIHHQYSNRKAGVMSEPLPKKAVSKGESIAHYSFVTNKVGGIQSSTICVPTGLAKAVKFNEHFKGHQDWDFTLKVGGLTQDFRFIEKVLTIRSKDSQDSVADGLDWQYSLWFYCQLFKYFENIPAFYYFQHIVLNRAKLSSQLTPIFFNKLFIRVLLTKPFDTLKCSVLFISKNLILNSRVKKVRRICRDNNFKTVMIWGSNDYAKSLILNFSGHINVTKIIDAKVTLSHCQLLGINILPIRAITRNELDNVDVIILATDHHQQSMKNELSSIAPTLLAKIIEF